MNDPSLGIINGMFRHDTTIRITIRLLHADSPRIALSGGHRTSNFACRLECRQFAGMPCPVYCIFGLVSRSHAGVRLFIHKYTHVYIMKLLSHVN